jgi:hypothetical protein
MRAIEAENYFAAVSAPEHRLVGARTDASSTARGVNSRSSLSPARPHLAD